MYEDYIYPPEKMEVVPYTTSDGSSTLRFVHRFEDGHTSIFLDRNSVRKLRDQLNDFLENNHGYIRNNLS